MDGVIQSELFGCLDAWCDPERVVQANTSDPTFLSPEQEQHFRISFFGCNDILILWTTQHMLSFNVERDFCVFIEEPKKKESDYKKIGETIPWYRVHDIWHHEGTQTAAACRKFLTHNWRNLRVSFRSAHITSKPPHSLPYFSSAWFPMSDCAERKSFHRRQKAEKPKHRK